MSTVPFTPALKAKLEVLLGERGNAMDAAVRKRELVQTRDALRAYAATVGPEGGGTGGGGGIGSEEYEELSHRINNALTLIDAAQADANAAATVAGNALSAANAAGAYTDDAVQQARDDLAMDYQAAVDAATNAANSAAAANTSAGLSAAAKDGAEAAATASINARGEAVAAAGDAGSYAAASEASKLAAETAKGQAVTARDDAVTAKNDADGARVGAMSAMEMSARIASRGTSVMADPFLQSPRWSVVGAAGNVTMLASEQYPVGKTWVIAAPANNDALGIMLNGSDAEDWPGQAGALGYVIEVEATTSGNLMNAGVRLSWRASSGSEWFADVPLTAMRSGAAPPGGKMTTFRGVITRPAGFTGTFSRHDLWVYGTAPFGNPRTQALTLRVHRINVRVATEEEMGAGKVMDAVQAKLTSEYMTAAATTGAIASMQSTIVADFAGTVASAERSATALAGLNGTVARFRDVVTVNGEKQAGIEAVAWDGAGAGSGSVVKLIGDHVVALGTLSAGALTVGIGGNLVQNSDFLDGARHWQLAGTGTLEILPPGSAQAHPGAPTLRLFNAAAQSGNTPSVLYAPQTDDVTMIGGEATPGQTYLASVYLGTANAQGRIRLEFFDAAGAATGNGTYTAYTSGFGDGADNPDTWPRLHTKALAPPNTRFWRIRAQKSVATNPAISSGIVLWKPQCEAVEASASQPGPWRSGKIGMFTGDRLFSQSIRTYHLDVEWMTAGRISAAYLDVDALITIKDSGALSAFKQAADDTTDGIYFGKVEDKFALSASRTAVDGKIQEVSFTSDGFRLTNPSFFKRSTAADPYTMIITSQTISLAGKTMVRVSNMIGGGSSYAVFRNNDGNNVVTGNPGQPTKVKIYDGSVLKHEAVAPGGSVRTGIWPQLIAGANPIQPGNRGAGRDGSKAGGGQGNSLGWIDITGWADPKITIEIGAGAAPGVGGAIIYQTSAVADVRTDTVPLRGLSGAFVKNNNAVGSFPDMGAGLGAGIWVLYSTSEFTFNRIDPGDGNLMGPLTGRVMTIISSKTPTYDANGGNPTIYFRYFAMGET